MATVDTTPQHKIIQLIRSRAEQKNITIERGNDPRRGGASRGRRTVWIPTTNGGRKSYDYTDTIEGIGLRLHLITPSERDEIYLSSDNYARCRCGAVTRKYGFFQQFGYCGNCLPQNDKTKEASV